MNVPSFLKSPCLLLLLCCLLCPWWVQASVVVTGTRVIYDETKKESVVRLRQTGEVPVLVQLWLDDGDDNLEAHTKQTPFLITPAVTRMDPDAGQSVRIQRVGEAISQDRETLMFFNVLEIPFAPTAQRNAGDNFIQFSSRARLKFFYRPKGLRPEPEKVHQLLRFSLLPERNERGEWQVRISNPTPYHAVFKDLALRTGADATTPALAELSPALGVNDTTVAPMAELVLPLKPASDALALGVSAIQVAYGVVGDYGNIIAGQRPLD